METYRHGSHTVFSIYLHLVWITKYRKKLLTDEVPFRVRDMIRKICRQEDIEKIKGDVSQDHIHLFVSIPPQVTVSRFVQRVKGRTSHKLLSEYSHLRKTCRVRHFLGAGLFLLQRR